MRSSLLGLGLLLSAAACQYDLDKLYRYETFDAAVSTTDAATEAGAPSTPDDLIDLFSAQGFVDADCRSCANAKCQTTEDSCRMDAACADLITCAAESVDPDRLSSCRNAQADWCAEDVVGHGLGGPFYTCVFRDSCSKECSTGSDWSCLGKYTWETTAEESVLAHMRFYDALDGMPAAGISVKVCAASDMDCESPSSSKRTDKDGAVTLALPTPLRSFRGYLRLEGTSWYPTLVQFGYPIARESVIAVPIVTDRNVKLSIAVSGVDPDPARGQLQLRMFGCAGVPMRDVTFKASKADENSRTWYYDGMAVQFDTDKTTTFGNGGIINVGGGLNEVTATLDGKVVARTSASVRQGFLTIVVLAPLDSSQL